MGLPHDEGRRQPRLTQCAALGALIFGNIKEDHPVRCPDDWAVDLHDTATALCTQFQLEDTDVAQVLEIFEGRQQAIFNALYHQPASMLGPRQSRVAWRANALHRSFFFSFRRLRRRNEKKKRFPRGLRPPQPPLGDFDVALPLCKPSCARPQCLAASVLTCTTQWSEGSRQKAKR